MEKLKCSLPFDQKKTIVQGLFISVLTYCLPVFGGCDRGELDSLQIMQNRAARLITDCGLRTPRHDLYRMTGWLTVRQLVFYHTALCTFRIRLNKEPEYLSQLMNRNNRYDKIIVPNTRLSLALNSYCFRGASQWNRLPENIRLCTEARRFKSLLKSWIQTNVPQFGED